MQRGERECFMRIAVFSDSHGVKEPMLAAIEEQKPDMVLHLGDYVRDAEAIAAYFPSLDLRYVRGNCDAEVDQMVLDFPVMADYATLFDETGRELFLTHGHVFGAGMHNSVDHAPALPEGSALVYGHTHVKVNEESAAHPGLWLFNPGSVSIPKDGTHSYGIYEGGAFRHVVLEEE